MAEGRKQLHFRVGKCLRAIQRELGAQYSKAHSAEERAKEQDSISPLQAALQANSIRVRKKPTQDVRNDGECRSQQIPGRRQTCGEISERDWSSGRDSWNDNLISQAPLRRSQLDVR